MVKAWAQAKEDKGGRGGGCKGFQTQTMSALAYEVYPACNIPAC